MELMDLLKNRRSVREYAEGPIPQEKLDMIIQAGLISESAKNLKSCEFIVVQDKEMLEKLSGCRPMGSQLIKNAGCAIVVLGDTSKTDVWTEDGSIAMAHMHLMADALGLGSCWVQGRMRPSQDGRKAEDYVRDLLGFPEHMALEAILAIGNLKKHPAAKEVTPELYAKVHNEKY